jgi:topoisomerase IV subunit B
MNDILNTAKYDESKIQTLSSLEHIRLRTGMYIGRLGDGSTYEDGIYILLKEIVDNSIDEYIEGFGKKINIEIDGTRVSVRDFGRGIPLGKMIDCVSVINTGGKFNSDVFQFSVGLNGVGSKAVNALSESFVVRSHREGKYKEAHFSRGKLVRESSGATKEPDGTYTEFIPDKEIFKEFSYNFDFVRKRLNYYAYLNKGLKINFNDEKIVSTGGLLDLLNEQVESPMYEPIYYSADKLEFVFTHIESYGESYYSFVNGQYTNDGGTHQSAFKEAVLKAVNEYAKKQFEAKDVRDGIVGAVAVKIQNPVFESQTKNKLGNTEIKAGIISEVKDFLVDYFYKHQDVAQNIYDKIALNEKVRKELKNVQQQAKELSRNTAIRIPKLKDCKYHFNETPTGKKKDLWRGDESVIFLTEGDSAAGSMISCRDVETQAIFALKGKPKNVLGEKRNAIYKNEEFYNIIRTLNIEDGIDNLRYSKIIMATDSDPDGLHIRNLLLTFFLHFYESLVLKGHIYILETPLFRIRNKKQTIYCYNENEKKAAIKELGPDPEVTRFKGLGEISPKEFGRFIGPDIRLVQVSVEHLKDISNTLEFYMGSNTPERRNYIMENLDRIEETVEN